MSSDLRQDQDVLGSLQRVVVLRRVGLYENRIDVRRDKPQLSLELLVSNPYLVLI